MKKKPRNSSQLPLYFFRLTVLLIGCGLVFGALFIVSRFFTVKEVRCQLLSAEQTCPADLEQSLHVLTGSPIFFMDYSPLLSQSAVTSQPVSLVHIRKQFPRTLILTFQPEAAAYVLDSQGTQTVISHTGKVFNQQFDSTPGLVVESLQAVDTGSGSIDASVHHTIMNIITTTKTLELPLTRITWVDKSTIRLSIENRAESFILDSERPTLALHRLALVLKSNEYRDITEPKTELDLRFTMPVLRTQP